MRRMVHARAVRQVQTGVRIARPAILTPVCNPYTSPRMVQKCQTCRLVNKSLHQSRAHDRKISSLHHYSSFRANFSRGPHGAHGAQSTIIYTPFLFLLSILM